MKVLLLAGGNSSERNVSVNTGKSVYNALTRLGHQVIAIDPASGRSLLDGEGNYQLPEATADKSVLRAASGLVNELGKQQFEDAEVVFLALHGGAGEDGSIQNLLSLAGKKYTGSSMAASAVAMNKSMAKRLFQSVGIPTPDGETYRVGTDSSVVTLSQMITERFDLPVIVKPNGGGSTIGLTKVDSEDQLAAAFERAAREDKTILVEEYIKGRELTVAVLDRHAFPVVEIVPRSGLYDYEAKYTKGKSEYIAPAKIPEQVSREIRDAATKACEVIGTSGLARVDFILRDDGRYFCLEVNTLPGMTDLSLAPMAAKCEGIDFDLLVQKVIESGIKRED
jgi:D-alanine-D-alanine ligase